jgi:hypothetical protein
LATKFTKKGSNKTLKRQKQMTGVNTTTKKQNNDWGEYKTKIRLSRLGLGF